MPKTARAWAIDLLIAIVAYAVLLPLSILLLDEAQPAALRAPIAALPALPLLLVFRAYLRYLEHAGEQAQRSQARALALAGGLTALSTFAYGLMVENAGLAALSPIWVLPLFVTIWGIATAGLNWRQQ